LAIDNYRNGLDARKNPLTTPAGALTRLSNAAVTPGGEIEKRRAFVKVADLTGTVGLAALGNKVVAFSKSADMTAPALGMENITLEFHNVPIAAGNSTIKMMDYDIFDGAIYVTFYDKAAAGGKPSDYNPHFFDTADTTGTARKYEKSEGSGKGYFVKAYQSKVYSLYDKHVFFSAIKYPLLWNEAATVPPSGATVVSVLPVMGVANEMVILPAKKMCYTWTADANGIYSWVASTPSAADLVWIDQSTQRTGCGFIDVALQEGGGVGLQGIEIYFDKLAIMSDQTTQLWSMDPDPNQNALSQVLRNNGTRAPKSVHQYGSGDVLYLSSSGLRSLKARDASNSAAVTDIGSPIDNIIKQLGMENGALYLKNCKAIIEPVIGRFWAVFPNEILVLSYFPGPAITAWSSYSVPFIIDYIVTAGDRVFIRSGNDLYAFGGKSGMEYDDCLVEVRFPYLDGGKPGHNKMFEALDATVEGAWQASVSYNYDLPEAEEFLGTMISPTWNKGRFGMQGYASHVSMRFYHQAPGPATLCNAAIHFRVSDDEA
jgi:hypothetical protein